MLIHLDRYYKEAVGEEPAPELFRKKGKNRGEPRTGGGRYNEKHKGAAGAPKRGPPADGDTQKARGLIFQVVL
jgi:hypothetical protein